jgi:L-ascorbate metabolism protein UlaG (beta-lactamase superfamily)
MKIQFLGYGDAFDLELGNSAAILTYERDKILIDCGYTTYQALREHRLLDRITHILITHLHNDHSGTLATLLLHRAIFSGLKTIILYPDDEFAKDLKDFLKVQVGNPEKLCSFQKLDNIPYAGFINSTGYHVKYLRTYAYYFKDSHKTIVYSGDLGDPDFLFRELKTRGIEKARVFHDVAFYPNSVHAYYRNLQLRMNEYEIIGYHHDPRKKPKDCKIPSVSDFPELTFNSKSPLAITKSHSREKSL